MVRSTHGFSDKLPIVMTASVQNEGVSVNDADNKEPPSSKLYEYWSLFVKGEHQKCVERLFQDGWLTKSHLTKNRDLLELFLASCKELSDFTKLNGSIRSTMREEVFNEITEIPLAIADVYYQEWCKLCQVQGHGLAELESHIRDFAARLEADASNTDDLYRFVKVYLVDVQVNLLRRQLDKSLYLQLKSVLQPAIQEQLTNPFERDSGFSIEQEILHQLDQQTHSTETPKPASVAKKGTMEIKPHKKLPLQVQAPKNLLQLVQSRLKSILPFFQRLRFDKDRTSFLFLAALFLLLLSGTAKRALRAPAAAIYHAWRVSKPMLGLLYRVLSSV